MKKQQLLAIISLLCSFLGIIMLLISLTTTYSREVSISHIPKPLRNYEIMAVDSSGNIYFELPHFGSVQVYDNDGEFLYCVELPAKFEWFLEDNSLHLITRMSAQQYRHIELKGVIEVANTVIDTKEVEEIRSLFYSEQEETFVDQEGNQYKIRDNAIIKYNDEKEPVAYITPQGAILPLPLGVWWAVFFFGLIGFIVLMPGMRQAYKQLIWNPFKVGK